MVDGTSTPPIPNRQHNDNVVLNLLRQQFATSADAFDWQVRLGMTNEADIAAHYPYTPERFRVFVNGTRQFLQYGSAPEYENLVDGHRLKPQSAGDVVTMETTEAYRYVVGYVLEWSAALRTNQSLQSGEIVTFGYGDSDLDNSTGASLGPNADGWFFYWTGAHADREITVAEYRDGTELDAETVTLEKDTTVWKRLASLINWYNVGHARYIETYTEDGEQRNPTVAKTSIDDGKGAQTSNKSVQLSVKAEGGAGSLEAELGSVGVRTLGDVQAITREKTGAFEASVGTTGAWVPIYAIRVDPERGIVNTQLRNTDIAKYSASADIQVMAREFAPENLRDDSGNQLTDADWASPSEQSETNSVVQATTAVGQFPDSSGSLVTSTTDPGGFQLGFASLYASGSGSKTTVRGGSGQTRKRQVSDRDVCVFLANAGATGDVTCEYITEQDF